MNKIFELIQKRKVLIVAGTGGVGKTTVSAALGVYGAMLGKRTLVITIDPAKRLASSLGIEKFEGKPKNLDKLFLETVSDLRSQGFTVPDEGLRDGSLSALMPDTERTFEELVEMLTSNPALQRRVLDNPIFEILAKEFSGANEYMALQTLRDIQKTKEYDLIILDTPPGRHTLEFLDAPKLLSRLFEERLIRWLVLPTNKIVSAGMRKVLGLLESLTGGKFINSLVDFASALFEVRVKFTKHLDSVMEFLCSSEAGFVFVTQPTPDTAPEAIHLLKTLKKNNFHYDGIILNRTMGYFGELSHTDGEGEYQEKGIEIIQKIQERETQVLDTLEKSFQEDYDQGDLKILARLPEFARDIHSVQDLFHVALSLGHL